MKPDVREKFVVGNWKMHTTAAEVQRLASRHVHGWGRR
jgi:triosephosphate isomerase